MTTVLLVRHGRTTANSDGTLAGWSPGVLLDEHGEAQTKALAGRIAKVPMSAVVSSPLERCQQTAELLVAGRDVPVKLDDDLGEVRYGEWTGERIKSLSRQPMWKVVQQHPSAAVFPGPNGEGLATMSARAVAAVRRWNEQLGADAVYCVVSHGDVIKAILADALGLHLDQFQRIVVDPASLSVVRYGTTRPFVERMNDNGGDVSALVPKRRRRRSARADDADVGGGAGPTPRKTRPRRRSS
ncbi:MAG TPA: histidine phosphatase family protein [Actinomycetes bacterium]|nr:histidine phosphatase family protein [Actinomycetes bacterium]